MFTKLIHTFVARPEIYNIVQILVGSKKIRRWLAASLSSIPSPRNAIDIGGGTGLNRSLFSETTNYYCLEPDIKKIPSFSRGSFIQGDGLALPFHNDSVDMAMCTFVLHHIEDTLIIPFLSEIARVLVPQGNFIFMDGVLDPSRSMSRLLWHYDRGKFPRKETDQRTLLENFFSCVDFQSYSVIHRYVLFIGKPKKVN